MNFRSTLILINVVAFALIATYLVWRVISVRRNPDTKVAENLGPGMTDTELEGPRLERALGTSLIFVLVVALALPLYFIFEPDRKVRALEGFDERAAARGAVLFSNNQMPQYDPTKSLLCANCHGVDAQGGNAPFVIQPELDKCTDTENKSNVAVPECLPQQVAWAAPPLDTVLLRFDESQVYNILTWGRPGSPMPAWGVESGKGVLNSQSINDLIAYLKSIQISSSAAKERSTKNAVDYRQNAAKNATDQQAALTAAQATLAKARSGGSPAALVAAQLKVDEQTVVVAKAQAWADQVSKMSEGEVLFRTNCARCHTKGASYFDPNDLRLAGKEVPAGSGAFGPSLRAGATLEQFPGLAGEQLQYNWIALSAPVNEGYGVRGISSGQMPHFVHLLSSDQIKAIVAYERSL